MNGNLATKTVLLDYWRRLSSRISINENPEHEQAIKLRLTIGLGLIAYFCFPWAENESLIHALTTLPSLMTLVYYFLAVSIAIAIIINPSPSPIRRVLGSALDLLSLSFVMLLAGEDSVYFFVLYLWVIHGNGFRYGTFYLYTSLSIGVVGFSFAIIWGSYWQEPQHIPIAISLLILLTIIPLYSAFLIKKLHNAIKTAELANQAKSRFLANMSHELRTPLNGVIGIADLMGETELSTEQREFVKIMRNSGNTLLGLIENVLDISKIEAGKIEIKHAEFDLHEFITIILNMQQPMAKTKNIELFCSIDPQINYMVSGDAQHLRQIIINLVSNAIKFTQQGHVKLTLKQTVKSEQSQTIRFEISDTGIGIPEEALDNIFDDFNQVRSAAGNVSGTGLGTTIAKDLVELMNGSIGVTSQIDIGTTFWFELSFDVVKKEHMTLDTHKIMLVTSPARYKKLASMMESWGVKPELVENSAQAISSLIKAAESAEPFSTCIVDGEAMLQVEPSKYAQLVKSDIQLANLSLILLNSHQLHIDEVITNHYISVIEPDLDKRALFNALHAAHSNVYDDNKVVHLSDFYAGQSLNRQLTILIAEDNKVNQHVLNGILQHAGHHTLIADTGEKALDIISGTDHGVDMVILDMNMPGMSGLEVLKAFRFMDTSGSVPVMMITADATPETRKNCLQAGANEFLTKPINSRELLKKISLLSDTISPIDMATDAIPSSDIEGLLDEDAFQQLASLGDNQFLQTLVESFKHDALKHIKLIKMHCIDDYLSLRESLHALKGSATEMCAKKLASRCADAEKVKPDQIGQTEQLQLASDIEDLVNQTINHLEKKLSSTHQNQAKE